MIEMMGPVAIPAMASATSSGSAKVTKVPDEEWDECDARRARATGDAPACHCPCEPARAARRRSAAPSRRRARCGSPSGSEAGPPPANPAFAEALIAASHARDARPLDQVQAEVPPPGRWLGACAGRCAAACPGRSEVTRDCRATMPTRVSSATPFRAHFAQPFAATRMGLHMSRRGGEIDGVGAIHDRRTT